MWLSLTRFLLLGFTVFRSNSSVFDRVLSLSLCFGFLAPSRCTLEYVSLSRRVGVHVALLGAKEKQKRQRIQ